MPKVRRSKKSPPEGWELIEPTLEELEQKMREGNYSTHTYTHTLVSCTSVGCRESELSFKAGEPSSSPDRYWPLIMGSGG